MPRRKRRNSNSNEILERGNLYFFYLPRAEREGVEGIKNIVKFTLLLAPRGLNKIRSLLIAKNRMPDVKNGGEMSLGVVEKVLQNGSESAEQSMTDLAQVASEVLKENNEKSTDVQPRSAGVGSYAIVKHTDHTHFAYVLDENAPASAVQEELHIKEEANYLLTIKNPNEIALDKSENGNKPDEKPALPEYITEAFAGKKLAAAEPVNVLDYEHLQVLLIGAAQKYTERLRIAYDAEIENEDTANLFNYLRLNQASALKFGTL